MRRHGYPMFAIHARSEPTNIFAKYGKSPSDGKQRR